MAPRAEDSFVLGVDLDGCVADFVGTMRHLYSEWAEVPLEDLISDPKHGMPEWGLRQPSGDDAGEYPRLHRYAVTQKDLFEVMRPMPGAGPVLRRLSSEGVWIRIATHRLFIENFHEQAATQTIRWLEKHDIRYRDLCLIEDKTAVRVDMFVEDRPSTLLALQKSGVKTVCFTNGTNRDVQGIINRVQSWDEAERLIRSEYNLWRVGKGLTPITV